MSNAEEFKIEGMKAFKAGKWQNSIDAYSRAMELDQHNAALFQNRAAAFIKAGDYEKALHDAEECIRLDPKYSKGHVRKGAALQAMRNYDESIAAYQVGLNSCPGNEHLQQGLAFANRAKQQHPHASSSSSKVHQAAHKSHVARRASLHRSIQAQRAPTVSAFVQQTRLELKLQMTALQAQLDLFDELASMTSDQDKLQVLFTLVDEDRDGKVDARELANALRKGNDLSFSESLERAINMVAIFDTDGDTKLDFTEFGKFVHDMLQELGGASFTEFVEFLILQLVFSSSSSGDTTTTTGIGTVKEEQDEIEMMLTKESSEDISNEVKAREELLDMLADNRLAEIFKLFDKDGSGTLTFTEVAVGLYQLTQDMEESARTTLELLLTLDKDQTRTLNYEQFARFMMAFVAASGDDMTFDEIVDSIILALSANDNTVTEDALASLLLADEIYNDATAMEKDIAEEEAKVADALSYGRLQKLFDFWDKDKSGEIDFKELVAGLKEFQQAAGVDEDAECQAAALLGCDTDGDMKLGPHDFTRAMIRYAKAYEVELHDLIDFMCVTTALSEDKSKRFSRAYRQSFTASPDNTAVIATNLDYYEEPADDEYFL